MTTEPSTSGRTAEREDLRARLAEAEEVLRAIRNGEVDAMVLAGESGDQIFTLTEQRLHEQIVAAERLARLILEQAAEAIVVCDEHGRVMRASQAAQQFCDGSPLQRPFADAFPLRTDAPGPFRLSPVFQGETLRNVDVALDRHGQHIELILNAGPLLSDHQIVGCVISLTDITERKRAEGTLKLSSVILRNMTEGIVLIGLDDGIIKYATPPFEKMFGYNPGELVGKDILTVNAPTTKPPEATKEEILGRLRQTGEWHSDIENIRKDGTRFWCYANVSLFDDSILGRVCISVHTDITERKRTEEKMEQQMDELRRWHELTLGREMRVIELKREVNALLAKAGQPPRYGSAEEETGTGATP